MPQDQRLSNLLSVVKEQYTRLVWTHKVHEKEREILAKKSDKIKTWNVILVAVTALLAAYSAYSPTREVTLLTALIGAFSAAFLEYQRHFGGDSKIVEHRAAAKHIISLRDRTLFMIENIISENGTYETLRHDVEKLRLEEIKVLELIPDTSPEALELAADALNKKKDNTNLDSDADKFLPRALQNKP